MASSGLAAATDQGRTARSDTMAKRSSQGLASLIEERPVESFNQLDVAARVVPLHNWFFVAAAFLTLGALAAFSYWYQVPLKVEGRGILLDKHAKGFGSLLQVTAPATGRIRNVAVTNGSIVNAGDVLAEIDQKELGDEVASATAELARLREEDARTTQLEEDEARAKAESQAKLEAALGRGLVLDRARLSTHRRIVAGDLYLKSRAMVSESDALKARAAADEVEGGIAAAEARLHQIAYDRVRDDTTRRRDSLKRQLGIRAAETKLGLLQARFDRDTRIVSPYAGKVVDLLITDHGPVQMGTIAALLRPVDSESGALEAILFVPAGMGKKIRVGDAVEVVPDTVLREEHGFIRAEIRSVAEMPRTGESMLAELKNSALVAGFLEAYRGKVLLTIHSALRDAPAGRAEGAHGRLNGLDWSSASGASQRVSSGTLCSASIVVERQPLIALAMPWFKRLIGID
jgi:HlyD family secretion protein